MGYEKIIAQDLGKFKTVAWFCLVFGGGCQFLAGIMNLANKNTLGGTLSIIIRMELQSPGLQILERGGPGRPETPRRQDRAGQNAQSFHRRPPPV